MTSRPAVSEDSVHNGSKSDDSTTDGESSPNEYVQDSLDFGEYEDPELDFDQYELTRVTPAPQDKATAEPEDQSYTDTVMEIIDETILTHLFAQPLEVDAVTAEMNNQIGAAKNQDIILNCESIPHQPSCTPNAENMGVTMEPEEQAMAVPVHAHQNQSANTLQRCGIQIKKNQDKEASVRKELEKLRSEISYESVSDHYLGMVHVLSLSGGPGWAIDPRSGKGRFSWYQSKGLEPREMFGY
ncbi:hypothetical protein Scep_027926 [Stephania cephalantha]|uniref:Uncharacterized protein n=1 Tax=Stephania cephalantha TaxID=152367 RepID=A0AAP0HJ06_9MAGN